MTQSTQVSAPRILALFGARVIFGQERANMAVLASLRRQGCEVLCVIRHEDWPELLELRAALEAHGLPWTTAPYIDYPIGGWRLYVLMHNPGAYLAGNAALKRIAREFAATHIHAFNPLYVAAFWSALKSIDAPMIYRAGDRPVLHNAFHRAVWRFIRMRAGRFVANSRYTRDQVVATGVTADRILVLYSPPPERPTIPRNPPDPGGGDAFRFVFVGQVTEAKGVGLLVEAFRRLAPSHPQAELIVAGPIGDSAGDAWARRLRAKVLADPEVGERIRFVGKIDDAPGLMAECDVHVAPTLSPEPYGLVAVEAKSVGRPSIIFNQGGLAELVIDGEDGTVALELTVGALADAMEGYLNDPARAARQGAAARASMARFGFDQFAENWRRVYDEARPDRDVDRLQPCRGDRRVRDCTRRDQGGPRLSEPMNSGVEIPAPRILALFGARVFFGQERANVAALAALRSQGCEVLCVIRHEPWPELLNLRFVLEAHGLPWTTAPFMDYPIRGWRLYVLMRNPGAYLAGNAALKRIAREFAATHIHAFNPLYVAAFWSALKSIDAPMIYRAGDRPILHNAFYRAVWRFICKRTARFVADSRYVQVELVASGVDPDRITVLAPPPPERMSTMTDGLPDLAGDCYRFVFIGQITAAKGVDVLIEAFRQIAPAWPNTELCVAGRISDWEGDAWARRLRDATLADPVIGHRTRFLGWVEDAPGLISQCNVHVAPSVASEAYGLVIVEAKSVGRPSIVFDGSGMTELIADGSDGLVVREKTAAGLAAGMESYLREPQKAVSHGETARASLAQFGFDKFAETWRKVYDEA